MFDPIRAAISFRNQGDYDQAVWLTFLQTHFGKHLIDGWMLMRNVYGSFGDGPVWSYSKYQKDRNGFGKMLAANRKKLSNSNLSGRYSNHRQYQSRAAKHIEAVVGSFYDLISPFGGFRGLINHINVQRGQNPEESFDGLYEEMSQVEGFGRLGKFDFLTMIGKLQLAPIEPGTVYLKGATGPLRGANLLVHGDPDHGGASRQLISMIDRLDSYLNVGKQVIEDSLCNWQKSPDKFIYFRG